MTADKKCLQIIKRAKKAIYFVHEDMLINGNFVIQNLVSTEAKWMRTMKIFEICGRTIPLKISRQTNLLRKSKKRYQGRKAKMTELKCKLEMINC